MQRVPLLRALHRTEPTEVHCSQDFLAPVPGLEIERTFMNKMRSLRWNRSGGIVFVVLSLSLAVEIMVMQVAGASAPPPALIVSPNANLSNGETISVGVAPNGYFTPNVAVKIL